jgi:predicted RNase H-like HicB family nuclease
LSLITSPRIAPSIKNEGGFSVWVPDLPGCTSQADTLEQALNNIKEAIELYIEDNPTLHDSRDLDYKRQFIIPIRLVSD